MKRMLINATHEDELRVALVDGRSIYDLDIESTRTQKQRTGFIYKGRITTIAPSLEAAFVDFGSERHGFLPLKEISRHYFLKPASGEPQERPNISEVLKEGQEVMVQIDKEERGTKGAALTTYISLAGSYLVLMPNNPRAGGISRRIEGEERSELRTLLSQLNMPEGTGVIVRTAGLGKSLVELQWDLDVLLQHWKAIQQAYDERPAHFLIHQESDVVIRAIRDHMRQDIHEIIIDNPKIYEQAKHYINQVRPKFIERLILYDDPIPLFSRYKIEQQIEQAFQREVYLPSGGSVVIDPTEALISIDINSARATKGADIEETALNTNLEAAEEIAKQLRLRDMGGLIVIDFIDMTPIRNQREVENQLRNCLRLDRARIQVGRISRFGLLEMSRQRLRPSLGDTTRTTCPRCNGQGTVRGVDSMASTIMRAIAENASKEGTSQVQVQVPVDIATYILNEMRDKISAQQERFQTHILIIPNINLQSPQYNIRRIRSEARPGGRTAASHQLIEQPEIKAPSYKPAEERAKSEPAVRTLIPETQVPTAKEAESPSLIKRLWSSMFTSTEKEEAPPPEPTPTPQRPRDGRPPARGRGSGQQRRPASRQGQGQRSQRPRSAGPQRRGPPRSGTSSRRQYDNAPPPYPETHGRTPQPSAEPQKTTTDKKPDKADQPKE